MSKSGGARRIVEYLGSAHDETEVAALLEVGRQKIASRQGQGLLDLGVLPREVVNAVGGGLAVQGGVGSVVVVVVEPGLVGGLALGLAGVGVGVGPLAGQSTVKALDLAVGMGPVGVGVAVLDAGCGQDLVKGL